MSESEKVSISKACAPAKGSAPHGTENSRVWSLTQMGSGMAGPESRTLSCAFDRQTDEFGNFLREGPHPVIGKIQSYPAVAALLKPVEFRAAVTLDQVTGLLYRKLPSANGFSNSWLASGEIAMQSCVGTWGKVTSDRNTGIYKFEPLTLPGRTRPTFPDIDELIDELLENHVIDRLDHPVLGRLVMPASSPSAPDPQLQSASQVDEEDYDAPY